MIGMKLRVLLLSAIVAWQLMANSLNVAAQSLPIRKVVLVHGAFVDGSGWKGVYGILVRNGYHVEVVQHSLTSFRADVAATEAVLNRQTGPSVFTS